MLPVWLTRHQERWRCSLPLQLVCHSFSFYENGSGGTFSLGTDPAGWFVRVPWVRQAILPLRASAALSFPQRGMLWTASGGDGPSASQQCRGGGPPGVSVSPRRAVMPRVSQSANMSMATIYQWTVFAHNQMHDVFSNPFSNSPTLGGCPPTQFSSNIIYLELVSDTTS